MGMLAWTFLSLQIKEFRTLAFYINDSIFGSVFFFLTGLHFFHVIVGIILIGIILCNFPLTIPRLPITPYDLCRYYLGVRQPFYHLDTVRRLLKTLNLAELKSSFKYLYQKIKRVSLPLFRI